MQCFRKPVNRSRSEELLHETHKKQAISQNIKLLEIEDDPDLQFLLSGSGLVKVRSGSWKKTRFYKLQEDCKSVWYESKKTLQSNQTFSLEDVECVRSGRQTEGLRKHTEESLESRTFSILFKGRRRNLDLIAASDEEAKHWICGLEKIMSNMRNISQQRKTQHWIFNSLRKADINCDNKLSPEELKHFLSEINIEVDDQYFMMVFERCDESQCGSLEGEEIRRLYEILTSREEVDVIYGVYAGADGLMSCADLLKFLQTEQKQTLDLTCAAEIIQRCEVDQTAKDKQMMTKDGFLMYLLQPDSLILNPHHRTVYQDMKLPLNHYYISSSHNTYLQEDQLRGASSTEAYIRALMKSCRCVELDVWDGSDGEPVVYHGYTLTSKILFKDAVRAIKENAFKMSEFPVILSLENHCSVEQQRLMAQHITSILGSALVTKPLEEHMPTELPSPQDLKGRFLIKGKRLNKLDAVFSEPAGEEEEESVTEEEDNRDDEEENSKKKCKKLKLARELSDVVIYCRSVEFCGFKHANSSQRFYEMSSFKEGLAVKLAEKSATEFIHHNSEKLSRIYPSSFRTDSSNYYPIPLWNAGCQIVALNFQTPCAEMDLNQGRFSQNGFCGYILKPDYLRDRSSEFDPITLTRGPWLRHREFHVMVISAQQLPKVKQKSSSIVDPLVRVEVHGVPADKAEKQTRHVHNNGFNPVWNENFQFDVYVPELALVRFVVEDYDPLTSNDFIAQCTVPFTSMQSGYRHVPLFNKNGDLLSSAGLFVHVLSVDAELDSQD